MSGLSDGSWFFILRLWHRTCPCPYVNRGYYYVDVVVGLARQYGGNAMKRTMMGFYPHRQHWQHSNYVTSLSRLWDVAMFPMHENDRS